MELTLAAAILAGVLSFLSPCVLPVVPAYLGQLGVVAATATTLVTAGVAGAATSSGGTATLSLATTPAVRLSRWRVLPHALAFVFGFGLVFTILGLTAYVAAGPIRENLPLLRQVGGLVLIVLGLNLAGVLRFRTLARSWRPLDRFSMGRRGGALAGTPLGALTLGAVFAVGWTPCIGPTLGAILTLSALGASPQVALLLVGYSIGLGVPFVLLALALDSARRFTRPFLRHARLIEVLGGALVVVIGLAILFDWLTLIYRAFAWLTPLA